jgi:hypothetical protein
MNTHELHTRITALATLFESHSQHYAWCRYQNGGNDFDCNCGLVDHLKLAAKWRDESNEAITNEQEARQ